jgi:DNA-directed RNA polymerase specialized sigma24 family protein
MDGHMKESNFPQPSSEQLAGFQEGDPLVANEIVELVLPSILRWAWTHYKLLPQDDVQDIVHQVLAEICHHSARYDPERAVFTTYVIGLLKLRLADLYATQQEIDEKVESGPDAYEKLLSLPYNDTETLDEDTRIVREDFFHQVEEHLEPVERELFQLMRKDVKSTRAFAAVLVRNGPVSDEEREVKNAKARLMRKVTFIAKTLGYAPEDLR